MASNVSVNVTDEDSQPKPNNKPSATTEEQAKELRKFLKLYFYSAFKWKDGSCSFHAFYCVIFLLQIIKVSLITYQCNGTSCEDNAPKNRLTVEDTPGNSSFPHLMVTCKFETTQNVCHSWETLPYPPSSGDFAVYTINELESAINFAVSSYYNVEHEATGYFVRMEEDYMTVTLKYYDFLELGDKIEWLETSFSTEMGLSKTVVGNDTFYSYNVTKELECLNISQPIKRITSSTLHFKLHSMRLHENSGLATCMDIKGEVLFTDLDNNGQVDVDLQTLTYKINCASMNIPVEDWQLFMKEVQAPLCRSVIAFCSISSILTFVNAVFGIFVLWKTRRFMKNHFEIYFGTNGSKEKNLPAREYLRFFKFWDILVKNFKLELLDNEAVLLGIGCIFTWFSLLRFFKFTSEFHLLFSTIHRALWDVLIYLVCVVVLFVGFWVCGYVVMGPYHVKFSSPAAAAETLFAMINGDEVYATFAVLEENKTGSKGVYLFSRFYIGTFVGIFTVVVINLLIALFNSAYETIQEYKKGNTEDSKTNALEKALRQFLIIYTDNNSTCETDLRNHFNTFLIGRNDNSDRGENLKSELLKLVQISDGKIKPARRRTLKALMEEGSQEKCPCIFVCPKQKELRETTL